MVMYTVTDTISKNPIVYKLITHEQPILAAQILDEVVIIPLVNKQIHIRTLKAVVALVQEHKTVP